MLEVEDAKYTIQMTRKFKKNYKLIRKQYKESHSEMFDI